MTIENDECLLRVIDCATMDTLQELVLYQVTESRSPAVETLREGCIVLRTWDGGLIVLDENEQGLYDIAIDIPLTEEEQINSGVGATLWDGERLAMAVPLHSMHRDTEELSGFWLRCMAPRGHAIPDGIPAARIPKVMIPGAE